jgi:hypothetical protein
MKIKPPGVSPWYYDAGISHKTASEPLAHTRARQNIQEVIAANIASEINARINIRALSIFQASSIEEAAYWVETALTNSIKTLVPRYETLEWFIETGKLGGKEYYIAYVLVRFQRKDILGMVEKIDPPRIAEALIQQMHISMQEVSLKAALVQELEAARDYALEGIREGYTDR